MAATTTMTMAGPARSPERTTTNSTQSGMLARPPPSFYLTIDGLLKSHASENTEIPLVGYPAAGVDDYEVHTAKAIDRYVDAACWWYQQNGLSVADSTADKAPVVALLTVSGVDAIVSFLALNRMGWACLFLSTRLTAPAYDALMKLADCNTIIAPPEYDTVIKELQTYTSCRHLPRINHSDYRSAANIPRFHRACDSLKESKKIAWIIHSSGSTGHPKPIFITNFGVLANFQKGLGFRSFTVSPLFHSHALMEFGRAIYAKKPMFFGNYNLPVTRQNLLAAMKVAKPEMVCAVPYVLKLIAEKEEGIAELAKAKIVMYGGSACPDPLGDELVSKGVLLAGNYGATETGFIMNSFRPAGDKEWNYLRLHRPVADHVLMDEISPGVFECVALDGLPSKDTTNSNDPPNSFRTRDLFTRHPDPTKSNYWKYLSRLDDRITLVNGEKVLPIPIEGHIRKHELIKECAVFGFQRTVPGLMVFRSEHAAGLTDAEFLDRIWPRVEEANSRAETFSHIPKDLIIVMPSDQMYPRTDKATIIRSALYEQFAPQIEQAYSSFEQGGKEGGLILAEPELESFLLSKFRELHIPLESSTTDIFTAGVDSLQTTRIWNMIKKEIDLGGNASKMSQNIVFERGTIKSLARYLYNLRLGVDEEDCDAVDDIQTMKDLISKYTTFTPHDPANKPEVTANTILLTGTTGGLGSILLANLLKREDVTRIYALVRADSVASAQLRVTDSLRSRNLLSGLPPSALSKLTALPGNFSLPTLGLEDRILAKLLSSLTHVIHSAWAVNFNLGILSFENQHIRGTYNMIEHIALRTTHSRPASFYFCSSVSTASGTPKPATILEAQIENLEHALPIGYGRSKLVTEHITYEAMKSTGMTARVLRIGQLAGDSVNAVWNDTEAIALMIRSALPSSAGCLPDLEETPSWLPVDIAAQVIEDVALDNDAVQRRIGDADLAYHVLNPRTFSFRTQLQPMLKAHPSMPKFEIVAPREWLDRLRASDDDVSRNPSRKLIDFWEGKYGNASTKASDTVQEDQMQQGLTFETMKTAQDSKVLDEVRDPVSSGLMSRIVQNWLGKWQKELNTVQ